MIHSKNTLNSCARKNDRRLSTGDLVQKCFRILLEEIGQVEKYLEILRSKESSARSKGGLSEKVIIAFDISCTFVFGTCSRTRPGEVGQVGRNY